MQASSLRQETKTYPKHCPVEVQNPRFKLHCFGLAASTKSESEARLESCWDPCFSKLGAKGRSPRKQRA